MADAILATALCLSQANSNFALDLYQVLGEEPGNLFFSPVSVHIALALMLIGSGGNTTKELSKGLHLPDEKQFVEDGANTIMRKLMMSTDVTLQIANKIFLQKEYEIKEGFKQSASRFLAGFEEVSFSEEQKTRNLINSWVDNSTNHKIKEIIPPGVLNDLTRMVLVNAIYFKGNWLKAFKKDDTKHMSFHSLGSSPKDVEMMYIKGKFKYADLEGLKAQALLLPYKGQEVGMLVILPKEENGITDAEHKLGTLNLRYIPNDMTEEEVHVYLPKFKMEYAKSLKESLKNLGMKSMFDGRSANFSGITDESIAVTEILHKAFIEVNEEGTEAAAATVVISGIRSAIARRIRPLIFRADHPFIFFLMDWSTGAVLFAGRFVNSPI